MQKSNECDPALLKEYFGKHLRNQEANYDPVNFNPVPEFIEDLQKIEHEHINTGPPGLEELIAVIRKLKDGKSANNIQQHSSNTQLIIMSSPKRSQLFMKQYGTIE